MVNVWCTLEKIHICYEQLLSMNTSKELDNMSSKPKHAAKNCTHINSFRKYDYYRNKIYLSIPKKYSTSHILPLSNQICLVCIFKILLGKLWDTRLNVHRKTKHQKINRNELFTWLREVKPQRWKVKLVLMHGHVPGLMNEMFKFC